MRLEKFKVLIQNGKITWSPKDKDRRSMALKQVEENYDGKCIITIDRFRPSITNKQRKKYWALLKEVSDVSGYDQKELHNICKAKYLTEVKEIDGKLEMQTKSLADLDTTEATVYMEFTINFLSEFFNIEKLDIHNE